MLLLSKPHLILSHSKVLAKRKDRWRTWLARFAPCISWVSMNVSCMGKFIQWWVGLFKRQNGFSVRLVSCFSNESNVDLSMQCTQERRGTNQCYSAPGK